MVSLVLSFLVFVLVGVEEEDGGMFFGLMILVKEDVELVRLLLENLNRLYDLF